MSGRTQARHQDYWAIRFPSSVRLLTSGTGRFQHDLIGNDAIEGIEAPWEKDGVRHWGPRCFRRAGPDR